MKKTPRAPAACPSCGGKLRVTEYACPDCGVRIQGDFEPPAAMELSPEDWHFVTVFMRNSGNMKDVQSELKLSYPTVRKMLDRVSEAFGGTPKKENASRDLENDTVARLRAGELSVEEALAILKKK